MKPYQKLPAPQNLEQITMNTGETGILSCLLQFGVITVAEYLLLLVWSFLSIQWRWCLCSEQEFQELQNDTAYLKAL